MTMKLHQPRAITGANGSDVVVKITIAHHVALQFACEDTLSGRTRSVARR